MCIRDRLIRHGVEVVVPKKIRCCGSLNHHLGKEEDAHHDFKNNINTWYEEHQKGNLDAILSNTSGCGTTMKDYGFIFRDDKELSKKAKVISDLTRDISFCTHPVKRATLAILFLVEDL